MWDGAAVLGDGLLGLRLDRWQASRLVRYYYHTTKMFPYRSLLACELDSLQVPFRHNPYYNSAIHTILAPFHNQQFPRKSEFYLTGSGRHPAQRVDFRLL